MEVRGRLLVIGHPEGKEFTFNPASATFVTP
jgi:hypothetical protein